jgi:hypothetical protein
LREVDPCAREISERLEHEVRVKPQAEEFEVDGKGHGADPHRASIVSTGDSVQKVQQKGGSW